MVKIGILALQGTVQKHVKCLKAIGVEAVLVKRRGQLAGLDGLILPSGEIATIRKLIERYELFEPLKQFGEAGNPIFGTCAGLILMAQSFVGEESSCLGLIDMKVQKYALDRQHDGFETKLMITGVGEDVRAVFIRTPKIVEVGENVEILSKYEEEIAVVKQDHYLACPFHPELTDDHRLHQYFIEMVRQAKK